MGRIQKVVVVKIGVQVTKFAKSANITYLYSKMQTVKLFINNILNRAIDTKDGSYNCQGDLKSMFKTLQDIFS